MAAKEGLRLTVREAIVNEDFPLPPGFRGSPTVLIGGVDVDPAVRDLPAAGFG